MSAKITVMGIYVADLSFWAARLPVMGETLLGTDFSTGPGGKGSNQAVAARRAGAEVSFITKIGRDELGKQVRQMYRDEGIDQDFVLESDSLPTGAAFIFKDEKTGDNAIIVVPGAATDLGPADVEKAEAAIAASAVFATQLETPIETGQRGLEIARRHGVTTILNPAPSAPLPEAIYGLVDYFTPNETEASDLAGLPVETLEQAEAAADVFLQRGVGTAIITLGGQGVLLKDGSGAAHIPAYDAGSVVDTTGAGDAFNGGLATGLAKGLDARAAARFGCAVGGLSVTKEGTAPSMPRADEIEALLRQHADA